MAATEFNKPPPLPPYPEMIVAALEALKEPGGSNKTSISKYIESKYGDLPAGHSQLLSHHLNRMKESGELVFWKNNYSIPDPNAPPRRGRGRPPKPKDSLPAAMAAPLAPPRPRGRPPKDPSGPKQVKPKVSAGSGRPRGRPRKMAKPTGGLGGLAEATASAVGSGRPRGRPPKVKAPLTEVSVEN
ncbi:HMG-Y-related protein A isoform X1 [Eucalyptus grandis]|uniref:HMG-Y-related protein A isoform X1 n=2 Tax=Eucalyptus grandis TaxID=71139 RepID=UPI00192ECE79|nr:HMG-Y-related protein A isoform X1 [Eucalyptus grandis]